MSLEVNLRHHANYLEFTVTGRYDHEDAVRRFSHVLDTCILTGKSKVLIDIIQMHQVTIQQKKCFMRFQWRNSISNI